MSKFYAKYLDDRGSIVDEQRFSAISQLMATQAALNSTPPGASQLVLLQEIRVMQVGSAKVTA